MKKLSLLLIVIILGVTGCGSNSPSVPKIKVTKKFQFTSVKLNLSQLVKTKIVYHTEKELEAILYNKIKILLEDNKLLSLDSTMNKLNIIANYQRRFVGDATPISTDSLGYPKYSYSIDIINDTKLIGSIKKDKLRFNGGFTMNLQVMAGTLRDKKYEIEFVEALANTIVEDIKNLN